MTLRGLTLGSLRALGACALMRRQRRQTVGVLMFHGVADGAGSAWKPLRERTSVAALERCLAVLGRHYRFVSLEDAVAMLAGRRPFEPNSLVLSFDDGYRNNLTHAWPVLKRFGAPMSLFVVSGKISERSLFAFDRVDYALQHMPGDELRLDLGGFVHTLQLRPRDALRRSFAALRDVLKRRLRDDLEYGPAVSRLVAECEQRAGCSLEALKESDEFSALLTWDDVRRLASEPSVEIGSHTCDHTRLGFADEATARDQLSRSRREIEAQSGRPCRYLAFPNGSYTTDVARWAEEAGFAGALTTDEGVNPPGQQVMTLRRLALPPDLDRTELESRLCGLSDTLTALKAQLLSAVGRARAEPA
jgi:peptidoglycan/xylan/chitin deacetylase (PgdA/CDA1 family)